MLIKVAEVTVNYGTDPSTILKPLEDKGFYTVIEDPTDDSGSHTYIIVKEKE